MAHRFTVNSTIQGVSIDQFKRLVANTALHEAVCRRIPGEKLEIIESKMSGDIYTLRRAYNLDINIPDMAKKFFKDAFRVKRTDITDLAALTSSIKLGANVPLEADCERLVTGDEQQIHISLNWHVKIKIPLIAGMLERHAETEIRKFSQLEIQIVEDELKKNLLA
ncbi:DUF2505 family protein [Acinetobacter sp. BSP-28]|uniref:DUF2505 family protein n=1 Tax=Acinetobacter sp. BSP-28 TaxID=3344661 RepID=UPI00377066AB